MSRDLIFIKLGGSLITDKRATAAAPRREVIERLAVEIAAARGEIAERLVLGHGSGSFGHVAAARHGLGRGRRDGADADPIGVSVTQDAAARLHRIVIAALVGAGVPAFSLAPSATLVAEGGRIVRGFLDPLEAALGEGLVPVVYGDVVADRTLGASICSTETALDYLARRLARRGVRVARLLWLGETDGIYDADGRTVPRVDRANARAVRALIGAPAGTDVTGGMLLRLETALALALGRRGVESWIFDGRRPGALAAALRGKEVPGTRVAPD